MAESRTAPLTEIPATDSEFEEAVEDETARLIERVARIRAEQRLRPLRALRTPTPLPRLTTANSTGDPPPAGKDETCPPSATTEEERAAEEAGAARARRRLAQISGTS